MQRGVLMWLCDLVQLSETKWWGGWGKEVPLSCSSSCWNSAQPSCVYMSTDENRNHNWKHNSGSSSLHSCFALFTMVIASRDPDSCFPCSKWWKSHWQQRERTRLSIDSFSPECRNKAADFEMQPSYLVSMFLSRFLGGPFKAASLMDTHRKRARHSKAWIMLNSSLVTHLMELWVIKWGFWERRWSRNLMLFATGLCVLFLCVLKKIGLFLKWSSLPFTSTHVALAPQLPL